MNTPYSTAPRTLRDYRLRYPQTASVATLTQSSLLWLLLERRSQMAAAHNRRRARMRKIAAAIRFAFAHPWRALCGDYFPPA
jgi:hypothetical protein